MTMTASRECSNHLISLSVGRRTLPFRPTGHKFNHIPSALWLSKFYYKADRNGGEAVTKRLFKPGHEPFGHKVNTYYKLSYLHVVLNSLENDHHRLLMMSQFGILLETRNKIASSVKFIHHLLSRQVFTDKLHEIWYLFSLQPFHFSLREFALATGIKCSPLPAEVESDVKVVSDEIKILVVSPINATPEWIMGNLTCNVFTVAYDINN